jgi:PPK2 family polyphosphate:nucleotide phosphotransferase
MPKQTGLLDALRVEPGSRVRLEKRDPGATLGHDKTTALAATQLQLVRLRDLQDRLWAESKQSVLVVLQGIDAAGKDGTIAKVMEAFDPQGCPVTPFKVPSTDELAHDFLWRIHKRTPAKGEIAIFNRSHYEDVLVVRVHHIVPRSVWSKRYDQINEFERTLAAAGTTIVKFFLTIDRDEQRRRLQERYDDPEKRWKFKLADLEERKRWDDYQVAFDDVLSKTSTTWAPWYVIPANRHWFRNLAVATILADSISRLKPTYPPEPDLPKDLVIE